jgi:feruloyl esterase
MKVVRFAAAVIGLLMVSAGAPALAQDAAAQCKALEGDHGGIMDAPSHVMSAKVVDAANGVPAHCRLEGYVQPNVGFELRIPTANWNENSSSTAAAVSAACCTPRRATSR